MNDSSGLKPIACFSWTTSSFFRARWKCKYISSLNHDAVRTIAVNTVSALLLGTETDDGFKFDQRWLVLNILGLTDSIVNTLIVTSSWAQNDFYKEQENTYVFPFFTSITCQPYASKRFRTSSVNATFVSPSIEMST